MRARIVVSLLLPAVLVTAGCGPSPEVIAADQRATLARYCFDCHDDAERTADLSLESLDLRAVGAHADVWERGSVEEALAALALTLELGAGTVNDVNARNETPMHGVMYRGGSLALIDFLVERGASLEGVVNSRGWTLLRIADGVGLDGLAFIRYPEAAEHLRALMRERGMPVPPVEWDGPREAAAQ